MLGTAVLSLAFFLSGAAGLIFQIVWFHRAGLVFGSSVWSVAAVLSGFMAGLALGNVVAGAFSGHKRPLALYAALEVVVAIAGLAATLALPRLSFFLAPISTLTQAESIVHVARFGLALVVLGVPAAAMGATLPVLVGALSRRHRFGLVLGRLYGWNTLGAVAGVLLAELVLIAQVGVWGTALSAALLNLAAAALAFVASRAAIGTSTVSHLPAERQASTSDGNRVHDRRTKVLACAFLAGTTLLALEVVWFRFLTMYVLSTTLAASLMLAAVLAAIGLGGLAASQLGRAPDAAARQMAIVACLGGCAVALSYVAFQVMTSGSQVGTWPRVLWFAIVLTFPTAFLSGMLFPLAGDVLRTAPGDATRAVARLAVANTAGALLGPPLAALVLLPRLGVERTLFLAAVVYGVIALTAWAARATTGNRWSFAAAIGLLAVVLAAFPWGAMSRYYARAAQPYAADGSQIVATREGPSETVFVMQQQWLGKPVYSRLVTNGFSMSGTTTPAMRYMRYFAYWPLFVREQPLRHALVICYGVGVTAAAVASIPSLATIDVAEISRDVAAMSDVIYAAADHPLRDPRIRLHVEDGRYFLETTNQRFDLITGEPPPPRTPGAANIYSREYFQLIHDRLADDGIATYWVPVARPDPGTDVDTIIRAFCDVFSDCSLWNATPYDLMLVGTRGASGGATIETFAGVWQLPTVQARLREVGFEQPEQIGATFLGDADYLRTLVAGTPPLTDNFPQRLVPVVSRPSLSDPRYQRDPAVLNRYQSVLDPARAREAFRASPFIRRLWPGPLVERSLPFFDRQRIINRVLWEGGRPLAQIEDLDAVLTGSTLRTLPLWILGSDEVRQRIAESADDRSGSVEYARALRALTGRDYAGAAALLARAEERGFTAPTLRPLRAYAACRGGSAATADALSAEARPSDGDERHFWEWMGRNCGPKR